MANALTYVKNVGKSFGYSAIETFKTYNPQITTLASGAKELGSTLYDTIQDFKQNMTDVDSEKGLLGKGRDSFSEIRKNLFDDLKSGNWYNKQRINDVDEKISAEMFGFDDDDFDLDDLDFDLDDDTDSNLDGDLASTIVNAEKESTNSIVSTIDAVGSKSSAAISTATVRSADYIVSSNRQSSKALYSLNQRGFHQMSTGLAAINANISSLISLGEPLTTHMQNASTYYTKSSEFQNSVIEKLDTLIKLNTPEEQDSRKRIDDTLISILDDGVINLNSYYEMISKRLKSFKDDMMGFTDMFGGPEQMIKMFTSSPMKFITNGAMKAAVPKMIKESMQSFNNTLESFFGAAIDKLENSDFKGTFGEVFNSIKEYILPKSGYKDKIDTSGYNKGKSSWTGKDQKALREVIPTYLSQIVSAITGGPETRYDYERGKFVTISGIRKEHDNKLIRYAQMAGGDFRQDAIDVVGNMGLSKKDQDNIKNQIEEFFVNMFKTGKGRIMDINKEDFNYKNYGLDDESVKVLRDVLASYVRLGKTDKANRTATEIRLQRDRYGDDLRYLESTGGITTALYDNSSVINKGDKDNKMKNGGIIGVDKYNNDIFFYLQGIYQFTGHLSDNIGFMGTGQGPVNGAPRIRPGVNLKPLRKISYKPTEQDKEDASKLNTETQKNDTGNGPIRSIDDLIYEKYKFEDGSKSRKGEKTTERANNKKQERAKLDSDRDIGIISEEEYQEKIKELENGANDSAADKLINRIRNRGGSEEKLTGVKKILGNIQGIFNKPAEVIAEILSAGEISLYHLLYGKNADDEKGLFAYFFEKANNIFDKFDNFLQDKFSFSIKEWAKKMFHKAGDSSFASDVKSELKNAGKYMKNDFSRLLGLNNTNESTDNGEGETEPINNNGQAALGRKVTKTGIVAVSEGEMIIPSDFNPHYHGTNNKATQLRNESKAIGKFFGKYANGGIIDDNDNEATSETVNHTGSADDYRSFWENLAYRNDGTVNTGRSNRNTRIDNARNSRNVRDFISGSTAQLFNSIEDFISAIKPPKGESEIVDKIISEENRKRLKEANIPDEVAKNRGSIGAGAIIGAGASILTGAFVGPIAGAAIGAGVGLVIRSEKVQKALFGEINEETGEREGGILSKKISNFITDQVPSIGKGAGYGAIGGLFLGSPILGAIVGGTVGYISSSEKAKAALFGKQNEDGSWSEGLIKKELQDKIKHNMPNIGAGMLAGMIAGPFGIVGNIVVGGALGYVSTTEKFKDMLLGERDEKGERHGGIAGSIRTYFFGKRENDEKQGVLVSINGIFHKLANEIRIHSRNLLKNTSKTIRKIISKGAKSTLGQFIATSKVGKAAKWLGGKAVGVAKAPLKMTRFGLEKIDTTLGRRALKRGYGFTGKDGRKMSAQERLDQRDAYGMNNSIKFKLNKQYKSNRNLDEYLANASEEQLKELKTVMQYYEDPTKKYDNDELEAKKDFANKLEEYGIDPETAVKLEKLAAKRKNNKKDIVSLLGKNQDLSDDKKKDLESIVDKIKEAQDGRVNAKQDRKAFQDEILAKSGILGKMKGVDINSDSDIRNIIDLINTEADARFNKTDEEKEKDKEEERRDQNNKNISTIAEIINKIYEHITGNSDFSERVEETNSNTDNGVGETEPIPEGSTVAAVSEGEEIIEPEENQDQVDESGSSKIRRKINSAFNRVKNGYHRLIGSFAEGGIVGGISSLVNNDSAIVTDKANIYILADNGGIIKGLDSNNVNPAMDAINETKSSVEGGNNSGLADERDDIVTQTDAFGNIYQMRRDEQGELQMDETDSQTQRAMDSQNKLKEALYSIPHIGTAIGGLGGLMGALKDGLIGNKEDGKEGLFSKLLGGLFGEDGMLSGLFSFITDSKLGTKVKSILGKKSSFGKTLFKNVVAPALLYMGFSGKFDDVAEKLTGGAFGKGSKADKKTATVKGDNGEDITVTAQTDDDGNETWTDDNGNVYDNSQVSDVNVAKTSPNSLSDNLKQNAVRGVLTNKKSVASHVLGKTAVGSKVKNVAKDIAGGIGDDAAATLAKNNLGDTIINACTKFTSMLKKVPALSNIADKLDDMGLALAEKMTDSLASQSAKKVAEFAKNAVVWAKVAFIVIDFTTGYEDARTTLGIVDEPSIGQRIVSGLLRAVKNFIPLIGSLIPDSAVIDLFCEYVAPALGINVEELKAQRKKAEETVDNWNATHEGDEQVSSVGEFNKKVLKDYTWTERIGNAAKSTWSDTKNKVGNMVSGIKEKGLGGYMKDSITEMGSNFMNSYEENGGGVGGAFNAMGDTFKNLLPGVLGDIAKAKMDIRAHAFKGEIGSLWKVTLPDFGGGGEKVEGTDLTTAVPGIFSKVVGQVPLILTKIACTPIALVSALFGKIKDFFTSDMFGNFVGGVNDLMGITPILKKTKDGDLGGVWGYSAADDNDNGFMKVIKTVPSTTMKIICTVPTIFFFLGKKVREFIGGIVDTTKENWSLLKESGAEMKKYSSKGEIGKVFTTKTPKMKGILMPLFTGIFNIEKIFLTISAIMHKVFNFIGGVIDKVKGFFKGIVGGGSELDELDYEKLNELTAKGAEAGVQVGNAALAAVNNKTTTSTTTTSETSGGGSGIFNKIKRKFSGGSSSIAEDKMEFISQKNGQFAGIPYADSNISNKGCAPAVATMLVNQNKPGSMSMRQAIKDASAYENQDGTSADYFGHVLRKRGISGQYINTKSGNGIEQLTSDLMSGKSAAVLGKDIGNTSKENSPFGPSNHYVMIKGFDEMGNVVVNDPELESGSRSYDPSILNNVSMAITTENTNKSKIKGSSKVSGSGSDDAKIYAYLKKLFNNDYAAAGIMGCWQEESNNTPSRVEGDYRSSFPGSDKVLSGNAALNDYTVNSLFPAYAKSGISIRKNAYLGGDKNYYPGVGLAQWTGPRGYNLFSFAKKRNLDWRDLETQLQFFSAEMNGNYSGVKKSLSKASSINEGTRIAYNKYEGCTREDWFQKRLKHAQKFHKSYSNKELPDVNIDSSTGGLKGIAEVGLNVGKKATSSSSNGPSLNQGISGSNNATEQGAENGSKPVGDILSTITSAFSTGLGKLFGKDDGSTSEDAGADQTSTSGKKSTLTGIAEAGADAGLAAVGKNKSSSGGTGTDKQKKLVQLMDSIKGKIQYSQSGPRNPEKGSADCSSTVNWAYKKVFGIDVGDNTLSMLNNKNTVIIDKAKNMPETGGQNSSGPDISKLEPGDILLYSRPTSGFSSGRKYRVGHVEMYTGDNRHIGHGSGMGPKYKPIEQDANRYIMAKRLKSLVGSDTSGAGSGLYNKLDRAAEVAKSIKGSYNNISKPIPKQVNVIRNSSGGSSNQTINKSVSNDSTILNALKILIKLVKNISDNSNNIPSIETVLTNYCEAKLTTEVDIAKADLNSSVNSSKESNKIDPSDDPALQDLMNTLNIIAAG